MSEARNTCLALKAQSLQARPKKSTPPPFRAGLEARPQEESGRVIQTKLSIVSRVGSPRGGWVSVLACSAPFGKRAAARAPGRRGIPPAAPRVGWRAQVGAPEQPLGRERQGADRAPSRTAPIGNGERTGRERRGEEQEDFLRGTYPPWGPTGGSVNEFVK